jgi:hypothetical protein
MPAVFRTIKQRLIIIFFLVYYKTNKNTKKEIFLISRTDHKYNLVVHFSLCCMHIEKEQ